MCHERVSHFLWSREGGLGRCARNRLRAGERGHPSPLRTALHDAQHRTTHRTDSPVDL
ncbi:hypothetical protein OG288_01360 [Streptomyces tauricus]|uniref:Uncharacterized protein n=1 Tax=Streptomyces tauricus TaxID=68274 RepID=A0ABZ1J623_9ACTN|nr:hypothetical protein [Streptomyces tauricus]